MDELSEAIEQYYTSSRPDGSGQLDQDALYRYVEDCTRKLKASESNANNSKRILKHIDPAFIPQTSWNVFTINSPADIKLSPNDLDIGVYINFKITWNDKERLLIKLSQIISKNDPQRTLLVKIVRKGYPASYPAVQIMNIRSRAIVNVSIAENHFFQKNEVIQQYVAYHAANYAKTKMVKSEDCIPKLIAFIEHWSRARGINNVYGYLNSFGFAVIVLKFIQWFELYRLQQRHKRWSMGEMLYEFFQFYVCKFDWDRHCVSIIAINQKMAVQNPSYKESIFDFKFQLNPPCAFQVVDPVNIKHNIAQNVATSNAQHIKYEFIRAVSVFERHKKNVFGALCDHKTDLVQNCSARTDWEGNLHVYYESFDHSYKVGKDTRYQYDPNVKCILTRVQRQQRQQRQRQQRRNQANYNY